MEEIKPVIVEQIEFEYRYESIITAICKIFGLSGFWDKAQARELFQEVP